VLSLKPTKQAAQFLEALPPKHFRQVWLKVLELLRDPFPPDSAQLKGYPYHRADCGEYRIVYEVDGSGDARSVKLVLIGKRNGDEVYERLKRL
jgi:mRNA interferase RelE/StbE